MKKLSFIPLYCLLFLVTASLTLAEDRLVIKDGSDNVRFVCTDSGEVGIDQETPLYKLDITANGVMKSQLHFSLDSDDVGGWITSVQDNNFYLSSGAVYDNPSGGWIQKTADGTATVAGSSAAGYKIYTASGTALGSTAPITPKFTVTPSGDVGIGTTTPQGKLDVNGSIYQSGELLHADYVFNKEYDLESIEKHSEFMWQNKHLMSVPKAIKDENGLEVVEVGAHRRGILEELEKAHIYIEQLNKRLKQLEAKLSN